MPHYRNGREAKVGDIVVASNYDGSKLVGAVAKIVPGSTSCNLYLMPGINVSESDTVKLIMPAGSGLQTYTAKECSLLVEESEKVG